MIYFFLRDHSFFTLQFLKAISKFQFHAVSNWLLENVLFYLTTAFLYFLFYLSMNLLNSSHAENKTLSLNNTRSPVLQWEFKIPLSSVIILKYIFSTGTRRESGIPIRENIFRAKGWSGDYACSVRWRCHLQPALFSAFYCRRCSDRKSGTRWLWTPTDTPRKVGPFGIFNPHLALVHHFLERPKVMAIEISIQCLVLDGGITMAGRRIA